MKVNDSFTVYSKYDSVVTIDKTDSMENLLTDTRKTDKNNLQNDGSFAVNK